MLHELHRVDMASLEGAGDPAHADFTLPVASGNSGFWMDGLGLVMVSGGTVRYGDVWAARLDGGLVACTKMPGGAQVWGSLPGWYRDADLPIIENSNGTSWAPVRLPSVAPETPPGWSSDGTGEAWWLWGAGFITGYPVPEWAYAFDGTHIHRTPLAGGAQQTVFTFSPSLSSANARYTLAPAGARPCSRWWCFNRTSGAGALWDMDANAVLARAFIPGGALAVGYSKKHDVLVAIYEADGGGKPYQLVVYSAGEPVAATVATPTFAPAPKRGALSVLSTTVLGAQGEACAGRVVTFAVSVGDLELVSVETDAAGVASTLYRAPLVAQTGCTVSATLDE